MNYRSGLALQASKVIRFNAHISSKTRKNLHPTIGTTSPKAIQVQFVISSHLRDCGLVRAFCPHFLMSNRQKTKICMYMDVLRFLKGAGVFWVGSPSFIMMEDDNHEFDEYGFEPGGTKGYLHQAQP